ncbi:unnamed protein product [Zymoseptoria tritici ST99CH_1E4]|uniref:F-box domain-containing protein n=1 Tax=Zymoseptoria tritici ST99CH_1E4 TaxID=1276532 RepID=A0A2H1GQA5_ZYMTR|nr:unnamed protein product [Zymoseptoria tritici ST99CH_1E4]
MNTQRPVSSASLIERMLTPELFGMIWLELFPHAHIAAHKLRLPEDPQDPFRVTLFARDEWARLFLLRKVSKTFKCMFDSALDDAKQHGKVRLIMNMARHNNCPAKSMDLKSLPTAMEAPMPFLATFPSLYVLDYQVIEIDSKEEDGDPQVRLEELEAEYVLPTGNLQLNYDDLFYLNTNIVYTTQTDANLAAFEEVIDDICDAIWHPDLLRPKVEPPYLAPLTKEGLYHLGCVFATGARRLAATRYAVTHGEENLTVDIGSHTHAVAWLGWFDEGGAERLKIEAKQLAEEAEQKEWDAANEAAKEKWWAGVQAEKALRPPVVLASAAEVGQKLLQEDPKEA